MIKMHLHIFTVAFLSVLFYLKVESQDASILLIYSNFQLIGCPEPSTLSPRAKESLNCLSNTNCRAFTCKPSPAYCTACNVDQINSLNFSSPGSYLKLRFLRRDMGYDPVRLDKDEVITMPNGLVPGDLFHVNATPLKYDSFTLDFLTKDNNLSYHLRARCDHNCAVKWTCQDKTCTKKFLIVSSLVNGVWDTSNRRRLDYTYSMKLNQPFDLHVLFQSNYILTYVNGVLYHNYITLLPPQSINSIRIGSKVNVHEISYKTALLLSKHKHPTFAEKDKIKVICLID